MKRKLRPAKYNNETKSTQDINEQAKVITKTLPKKQKDRLEDNATY